METQVRPVRSMAKPEHQVTRSVDVKARELTLMASTRAVDSYGTIILPNAFRGGMEQYMRNPIILKNHDKRGDVIAKTLSWKITDQGLEKRVKFAPTKAAEELFLLYAEGYMRSWSVGGGVPHTAIVKSTSPSNVLALLPGYAYQALIRDRTALAVYTEFILRETSAVTIGANPDALTKAVSNGLLSAETARAMYEGAVLAMSSSWIDKETSRLKAEVANASRRGADLTPRQRLAWGFLSQFSKT